MTIAEKTLVLLRLAESSHHDRTWGRLSVFDMLQAVVDFSTIELPWLENKRNISRIPEGKYRWVVEQSPDHFRGIPFVRILDVPGRSGILGHVGCFPRNTEGCVLMGMRFADLDGDGLFDAAESEKAMRLLCNVCGGVGAKGTLWVRDVIA
jgi:hypothetical protein